MAGKKIFRKILVVIAGFLLAWVAVELILQVTDVHNYAVLPTDPVSGLPIHPANSTYHTSANCFDNTVTVNNLGFHGPQVSIAKKPGVFRIVVIGSSFVEADQIPVAQMFPIVLEQLLNANPKRTFTYEVIPLGFSGNGTYLDALYYERFGEQLKPDLVIDLETEYEAYNEYAHADPQFDASDRPILTLPVHYATTPSPFKKWLHDTYHDSKLVMNMLSRYSGLSQSTATTETKTPATTTSDVWPKETALLDGLFHIVQMSGAKFLLTSWATSGASASIAADLTTHSTQIATADHFDYLDLEPILRADEKTQGTSVGWDCGEGHWSATGHEYAAQALYNYLMTHPYLLQK